MKRLRELGEFGMVNCMQTFFPDIGDDCAVVASPKEQLLATTDMLVEGHHFVRDEITPEALGHKSLAVSLSDIAAMGGTPNYALLAAALPGDLPVEWFDQFVLGLKKLADRMETRVVGGDTNASEFIAITTTVIGHARSPRLRAAAEVGDRIAVTGPLGDSRGGLLCLQRGLDIPSLLLVHQRPEPHLQEGRFLAAIAGVHSMIDLSDGLASDLRRIVEASNCGATIALEQLPISAHLAAFDPDPISIAASGGEDYCLLVTVTEEAFETTATQFAERFGRPLTAIGQIEAALGLRYFRDRQPVAPPQTFAHYHS